MRRLTFVIGLLVATLLAGATGLDAQAPASQGNGATAAAATVNINTATAADLQKLPGVGPATAQRIVEYREKNGAFKKVEELMNVRGVGEATFLKLKPLITVAVEKSEKSGGER